MAEFQVINTQEEFDEAVKERLNRQAKKYEGYMSPEDVNALKESYTGYTSPDSLEELKQGYVTQIDELTNKNKELEKANNAFKQEKMKFDIAHEFGIPREMANRLSGSDEDSLRKDAENFSRFVTKKQPLPLGSNEPSVDDKKANLKKVLDQFKGE